VWTIIAVGLAKWGAAALGAIVTALFVGLWRRELVRRERWNERHQ